MDILSCDAVAQASLTAATASLDGESAERLLYVAGWLTTGVDQMLLAVESAELELMLAAL
jgi:hypothetical protein